MIGKRPSAAQEMIEGSLTRSSKDLTVDSSRNVRQSIEPFNAYESGVEREA